MGARDFPMLRRCWRAESGIFFGVWVLLLLSGQSQLFRDPGTFWHTTTGDLMLRSGELVRSDPYSFTRAGEPWVPYEWLGEIGMALLHRLGGLDALLLATVTLLAGLYAWLAHRLMAAGLHWSLAVVAVVLTIGASSSHFHVRPHILTIVFFAWTFAWLCDFEAGRIGLRRLACLLPVYILWTNIHGGMLGGLGTMGLALAGWEAARWLGWHSPLTSIRQTAGLAAIVLACGLTALTTPYGTGLPRTWYEIIFNMPHLPELILEHAPLNPGRSDGQLVLLLALVYVVLLAGTWPRRPRITWLLPLVWLYLACHRIRHAPLFAVAAAVALAELLPYNRWVIRLAQSGSDLVRLPAHEREPRRPFPWQAALLPAMVVLLALALQIAAVPVPILGAGWARLDTGKWPTELLDELRAYERSQPPGTPIFNEYDLGGFLIYFTPNLRVFVDDRCEVYGDAWLKDFDDTMRRHPERIEDWARQYGFDHALVQTGSGFDQYLRSAPGWVEVKPAQPMVYERHRQPPAVLYRKKIRGDS